MSITILNDSFDQAIIIGSNDSISDSVDESFDPSDFYAFSLGENSFVDIYLSDLFSDADLYLYDSSRNLINSSENGGFDSEYLYEELSVGDYFIGVYGYLGFTDYFLDIYSFPSDTSIDDDSFETATPIESDDYRSDSVDESFDPSDFYTFSLRDNTFVDIQLFGLSADADLYLYDETGQEIAFSSFSGNTNESISQELAGGDYFIKVNAYSGLTDYELSIASSGNGEDSNFDDGNNTFETADSIGVGEEINQRVGISNDPNDYYSFSLSNPSTVNISLTGLSNNTDIELYDADRNYIDGSFSFGTEDELISTALPAGTYFIKVLAYEGETQYNLSLQSENATGVPDDNGGNDLNSALPIALNNNYSNWVGIEDTEDYYKLLLNSTTKIQVQLTGLSADADLELLDASGNIVSFSENGGPEDENIIQLLESGTYYLRVKPFGGVFTDYTLNVSGEQQLTPIDPNAFDPQRGYGFLDASLAVASVLGQNSFPSVDSFGGDNDWPINMVNAPTVWNQGYTGEGIIVAVLDTGVDRNHPDLFNNIWTNPGETPGDGIDNDGNGFTDDVWGWNFARNNNNTLDADGHGTHVAGTIAGSNDGTGVTGVAYEAQIMPVKVLGDNGSGSYEGIANGIVYAVQNGANVINMSLGSPDLAPVIKDAIAYASSQGVIVVSAAGNESEAEPSTPARYAVDYGVAVGAVGRSNNFADFSNQAGNNSSMIYVTAPGKGIFSSIPNGRFDTWNGTSMATPHVAGILALMLDANPNLTDAQARQIIASSTTDSPNITKNLGGFGIQSAKSSVAAPTFSFFSDGSTVNIPENTLLNDPFYRFQNTARPGTYLFAGEEERVSINRDFSPPFNEEGFAFNVSKEEQDRLIRFNRFQNKNVPGTYLFANEDESVSIRQSFPQFQEEGIAFYAFGADANRGQDVIRFQNISNPGTYIFALEDEAASIRKDFSSIFKEEGVAFEVTI